MRTAPVGPPARTRALTIARLAAAGVGVSVAVALVAEPEDVVPQGTVEAAATDTIRAFSPLQTGPEQAVAETKRRLAAADLAPLEAPVAEPEPQPDPEPEPEPAHEHEHEHVATTTADGRWDALARCESGGDWASTVGTYEGGLQFHPGTWDAYKDPGMPDAAYQASREVQIAVAERVLAQQGWGAWPACSRKLGYR